MIQMYYLVWARVLFEPSHEKINDNKDAQLISAFVFATQYNVSFTYTQSFKLLALLAHLSRQAHKVSLWYTHAPSSVRPSVVRPSVRRPPFSKIFFSETAWPIKAKFYMKHLWEGGTNVYINNPGHITKMAAMPIYGKNPSKIFFSRTGGLISTHHLRHFLVGKLKC